MKRIALFAAVVLALCSCGRKANWPDLPLAEVTDVFPDATSVETIDTAYYNVKKGDAVLGIVLFSSPYSDAVTGYAGATPLRIVLDENGKIKEVKLLENNDTPRFVQRVADGGLFEAWNGMTVEEALKANVDAVSGATFTSSGVKDSLKARLEAYLRQLKQ